MRAALAAVIVSLGFFALVAQTLLFRAHLLVFEGSELGIGAFFASWLLWVAAGAVAGRRMAFPLALCALLYLPAYLLQDTLIANARDLAGVVAYEAFPLARMVVLSFLVNAPVSFLTGFLFTRACRVAAGALPVARVYVLEGLGSFLGGLAVTAALVAGLSPSIAFSGAAVVLSAAVACRLGRRAPWVLPALVLVLLASIADRGPRRDWERLLPPEDYRGAFTTAQATYVHGEREGQFVVVAWGSVAEILPDTEHASQVVALTLAQNPAARRVLVVGPACLSVARRFLDLPQVESVVWLHPDPDYARSLLPRLPEALRAERLTAPGLDVRTYLAGNPAPFDLVILDLPDVTTLALSRYSTREFLAALRDRVAPGGVVGQRISGGANYLGDELIRLGASAFATLGAVFREVVVEPGEETWLLASDGDSLCVDAAVLRDRFAAIAVAPEIYPPAGLLELFPPERTRSQTERYRAAARERDLTNTDARPRALLHGLAVALRRTGRRLPPALLAAFAIGIAAIAVVVASRLAYLLLSPAPRSGLFDGGFLVLTTGLTGMATSIVLLFLYQVRHGSLYLHAGLAFSLFMLGIFLGGRTMERLLGRLGREPPWLLFLCVPTHLAFLALVPGAAGRPLFAALFVLAGVFTGIYFPLAAQHWKAAGRDEVAAGSALETMDHLGGAAGAVLTGLFLLPVIGTPATVGLLALLVAANLVFAAVPRRMGADARDPFAVRVRIAGYVAGCTVLGLLASSALAAAQGEGRRLESAAREFGGAPQERSATLADGSTLRYFELAESGYVFSTRRLSEGVAGYNGPIDLAVHVGRDGELLGYLVLHSRETPAYLARLETWRAGLLDRIVFLPDPFADVDTVTGATISSAAVLSTIETAGRRFAAEVLGRDVAASAERDSGPDRNFLVLSALLAGAILLRYRPGTWTRRLFLVAALGIGGFWLNLQFSTQQVFSLLSLEFVSLQWTGGFFLLVCVPVLVLLFGNVYCGYVCPFGALSELVGDVRAGGPALRPEAWRHVRVLKYGLLALLGLLFALTRDFGILASDPLIVFFGAQDPGWAFWLGLAGVALAFLFPRFWCRGLCPAGAFLALLNRVQVLRRILPRTHPGRCDLGVRTPRDLDCLCCDRCNRGPL